MLDCPALPVSGSGGNPRFEFRNTMFHAFKCMNAPRQPLTSEEMDRFTTENDAEWQDMTARNREEWRFVYDATVAQRKAASAAAALALQAGATGTTGAASCSSLCAMIGKL